MFIMDGILEFTNVAQNRGRGRLAGALDAAGTPFTLVFGSYCGYALLHGHGALGYVCILPIMCVDFFDGVLFTRLAAKIRTNDNHTDQDPDSAG